MSDPFYRSHRWIQLRADCLARDPVCRTPGCGRPSTHADHIVPRAEGGADALHNLRGLCPSCHNRRSATGNAAPRAVGCDERGQPLDPGHWWNR
jgi:5-methylcytosine-specific restriction endonuclease McrA